ncbi:MAG TPA: pyridoxamine 5'-phosphate oxidase [Saprospiraceae bacterium]|nr:pyridoxamine 5'-phosphate oxidase [Saprospiraceae bacterium]
MASLRVNYAQTSLDITDVDPNPFHQFSKWFKEATQSKVKEPNAMVLSTCGNDHFPESRTVLLKGFDENGFTFYTNYESDKGKQLAENNQCTLLFLWLDLERQVRIKGTASKVNRSESEEYFHSRPRESQIGAWTSPQSKEIPSRQYLESKYTTEVEKFADQEVISLPDFWGGYQINPIEFEFWQGRPSRLHDRITYKRTEDKWKIVRLAP